MSLRIILRSLAKAPVVTAVAVLSLALGIGGNAAMFSLLHQIVLRTLPVPDPERIALLYAPGPLQGSVSTDESQNPSFSLPAYRAMAATQIPFTGLAAARVFNGSVSYGGNPIREDISLVSGNYFAVLGVRPALGRLLTADDDVNAGGHPVAVLGYKYWSTRMGADPGVLNRGIVVNGYPLTVVGVAQAGFESEKQATTPALFVPLSMKAQMVPGRDDTQDRKSHWLPIFGRLKPGLTLADAQAAIQSAYTAVKEEEIRSLASPSASLLERYRGKKIVLKEGQFGRGGLREEGYTPILLLLGITGLVLLIACANVANLLLARSTARVREMALRVAVGASRSQIVRQLLAESWVLSSMAGVLGMFAAWAILRLMAAGVPPSAGVELVAEPDLRVLLFCAALCLVTGLVFGLFPALQATRPDVVAALKDQAGQSSSTGAANRFRRLLVTSQMAASLALLISAGLFGKSLVNLTRVDLGFRTGHLLSFAVDPRLNKYTNERSAAFYEQLETRLSAIPGVSLAAASRVPAAGGDQSGGNITVEGFVPAGEDADHSYYNVIGAGYFRTLGVPLVAGREFTEADNKAGPKAVMVNEAFVRHFFANLPGGANAAIGRAIGLGATKPDHTIVGVVKDATYSSIREQPKPVFYRPYRQSAGQTQMYFYVRTQVPPETLIPQIRREVSALDPNLPVSSLKTMQAHIDESLFAERILSFSVAAFAALATLLAAVGLYGVLAYNVERRTREIGIRMALGATATSVRAMVMGEVGKILAVGGALGAVAAWAIARVVRSLLFGMAGAEPVLYIGAAAVLAMVAFAAAFIPALRATRIDVLRALRYE